MLLQLSWVVLFFKSMNEMIFFNGYVSVDEKGRAKCGRVKISLFSSSAHDTL